MLGKQKRALALLRKLRSMPWAPVAALAVLLAPGLPHAAPHPYVATAVRAPTWTGYERHAAYVPVADGTPLALTWYLPQGGPAATRFPVLLWYTPGHRESINPRTGEIRPGIDPTELAYFTSRGYIVAAVEMRGSGASGGHRPLDRGPQIGADGRDVVNWIARQPWSDGRVGMIGVSYQGFSQFATAAERPAALKAIFPEIAGFDDYTSLYYPGGIANTALARVAFAAMGQDDRNEFDPEGRPPRWPSVPVVDEDGDGQLADEIPDYPAGSHRFVDTEARYADGAKRSGLYDRLTREHAANGVLTADRIGRAIFRDSQLADSGLSFADLDPGIRADRISAAGIAVYNRGGWFDYHVRDTTQWFGTLAGHTPDRLMMAPTGHTGLPATPGGSPYLARFGDRTSSNELVLAEKLRFFDRYVRGEQNGFDREPPVLLYVIGSGWRREDEWPLRRARTLKLSLAPDKRLVEGAVPEGVESWRVDYSANSLSQGANRWNFGIGGVKQPLSLDETLARRVAFTSEPLPEAREITGHPLVQIELGATAPSADVFVYLEDVAPDGRALLVTEGQLRADFHALRPVQQIASPASKLPVRPALPYHGYRRADQDPAPLAGDRVVSLRFDLLPTAWVFKAGHRIRVSLAGADDDSFERSPHAADGVLWRIRTGPAASSIELPWIPAATESGKRGK